MQPSHSLDSCSDGQVGYSLDGWRNEPFRTRRKKMYAEMIAMLFNIAILAVPALWVLDKALNWALDRWL